MLVHSVLREVGEGVKAINENLLTGGYVQAYAYARDARECARSFVNWGERWKSGEECKRKWGGVKARGRMRDGKRVDPEVKMEEGGVKRKARIGKRVLFCEKGSAEEKGRSGSSKNRLKSSSEWGKARKTEISG